MKSRLIILPVLLFFLHQFAQAQSDSAHLSTIAAELDKQTSTRPIEKVYLHLNKPAYQTGDTIWFKAYVTIGPRHQPSALSGILYAELIDGKDKIIKTNKLKITNGIAIGQIPLNDKQPTGNYHIRAYTNWMRNTGPEYFYNQAITVGDAADQAVFTQSAFTIKTNGDKVNGTITYTDQQGRVFNNKEVNYEFRTDSTIISKGKGITDNKGSLTITFPDDRLPKQQLTTHIKITKGTIINKAIPVNLQKGAADVQFFPEGGELIAGVRSKVAIKAIGINGLGINISGTITDNEHKEAAQFTTRHAGMGVFALTPEINKTYTATITLPDSSTTTIALPATTNKGFVLAINNTDSTNSYIHIATNEATLQENQNKTYYLVGQSAGTVYYTTAIKLDNPNFTATIAKSRFPTGIAQFTLFTDKMEPINERITFINNPNDQLSINLHTEKPTYAANEQVNLELLTTQAQTHQPAAGSFSISVYNEEQTPTNENSENTILSHILLTSDLQGYIEQPNYYFNHPTAQTNAELDNLLLTQGYRRFDWKELTSDHYPPIAYQPERTTTLSGTLTTNSGKPVASGRVSILSTVDKITIDTTSDSNGKFSFPGIEFPDSTKLIVRAHTADNKDNVNITINQGQAPPYMLKENAGSVNEYTLPTIPARTATIKPKTDTADIATIPVNTKPKFNFNENNKLKEVTIKTRKNAGTEFPPWQAEVKRSANLNGPGHADQVLTAEDVANCISLSDCLQAKIQGMVKSRNGNFGFTRHMAQSIMYPPPVVFIIDGQLISGTGSIAMLDLVNVDNILTIEVLKSTSYLSVYGSNASGGALVITTKIGNEGNENLPSKPAPGVAYVAFSGFAKARQFYIPRYTYARQNPNDTRDAIYWNPNIITDATGKCTLEFYNSAAKGNYRAVVEGIDDEGHIGRYVYRYKVE